MGFGDTLTLSLLPRNTDDEGTTGRDEFTCNMPGVPTDSTNLVVRALELMRRKTSSGDSYFRADLVKRVPAQAGLGGGSANAATAMWGANELLGRPATLDQVRRERGGGAREPIRSRRGRQKCAVVFVGAAVDFFSRVHSGRRNSFGFIVGTSRTSYDVSHRTIAFSPP